MQVFPTRDTSESHPELMDVHARDQSPPVEIHDELRDAKGGEK